jgi:hypothetical protein
MLQCHKPHESRDIHLEAIADASDVVMFNAYSTFPAERGTWRQAAPRAKRDTEMEMVISGLEQV